MIGTVHRIRSTEKRNSFDSKIDSFGAERQDVGDETLMWKSFDGVVGDTEIKLER